MWKWMMAAAALALAPACGAPSCAAGEQLVSVCMSCSGTTCAVMDSLCEATCTSSSECTTPNTCVNGTCQPAPCQ